MDRPFDYAAGTLFDFDGLSMAALRSFETPSDHRFEIRDVYRFD
jgi:hypothetical protein